MIAGETHRGITRLLQRDGQDSSEESQRSIDSCCLTSLRERCSCAARTQAITSLVRSEPLYVKISAAYRVNELAPGYSNLRLIVRALVDADPQMHL